MPVAASSAPRMSVLMPVRDGAPYVEEALASLRAQTLHEIEIIVVDDRSTDETPEILRRLAAADDRICILPATGSGIVDGLNQALAAARSDIIARLDADDVSEPDRLARQLAELEDRPDLVLLGSAATRIGSDGRVIGAIAVETDPERLAQQLRGGNPFLHPSVVMRRGAVEAAGGYRRPFALAEDYDLWIRLARLGEIANLPDPLIRLRRHRNQSSRLHRHAQRAVHALARLLAYGPSVATEAVVGLASPREAVAAYIRALAGARAALSRQDWRDVERMLRWYLALGTRDRDERKAAATLLCSGAPRPWSLLLGLRLLVAP